MFQRSLNIVWTSQSFSSNKIPICSCKIIGYRKIKIAFLKNMAWKPQEKANKISANQIGHVAQAPKKHCIFSPSQIPMCPPSPWATSFFWEAWVLRCPPLLVPLPSQHPPTRGGDYFHQNAKNSIFLVEFRELHLVGVTYFNLCKIVNLKMMWVFEVSMITNRSIFRVSLFSPGPSLPCLYVLCRTHPRAHIRLRGWLHVIYWSAQMHM